MAIVTSEKIFIDPNEEIVTIIERIQKAEKDRIILVIPQNSILLSSYISINILYREIAKSDKVVVLVTEDNYGQHIAERAGFIVTAKVSNITNEMWDDSQSNKLELISHLKNRKQENLQNISEQVQPEEITETMPDIKEESSVVNEAEPLSIDNNIEPKEDFEKLDQTQEIQSDIQNDILPQTSEVKENEDILKKYQKPRREPKMIDIDGITILSGGDMKKFNETPEIHDKIDHANMEEESIQSTTEQDSTEITRKPNKTFSEKVSFTGMDFKKPSQGSGFLASLFNRPKGRRPIDEELLNRQNEKNRKKILIIAGIILTLIAILIYIVSFRLSSVDITINLKKEDISTQGQVSVDTTISTIDKKAFVIPGQLLQENDITLSRTGEATGKGIGGNKSQGVIDILNTLDKDVTLAKGTKVTSTETNLVYVLLNDVTINKATPAAEGSTVSGATRLEDVPIQAENPGDQYNIIDADNNKDFKIEGYTLSQVKGSRYANITGGTTKEFTSVSQENIDTVKDTILPDLQKQAETKLNTLVPSGFTLLKETIKFEQTELSSSPALGEESSDKTFSLTLTGKISGLAIKQNDLEEIAKIILTNDKNEDITIDSLDDLQIDKVEEADGKYILSISSKGSLTQTLNKEDLKDKISGLSIEEVGSYFSLFDQIDNYRIVFAPQIVPGFLRRIPTDIDRINIEFK